MTKVYGIQGGVGSFNEEALGCYVREHNVNDYEVSYLFTTERVLHELDMCNIHFGLFAIQNSVGGVVTESIYAMANYKFKIMEEFAIKIQHHLMKRKDVDRSQIHTILAHPQVLKQCQNTLAQSYSDCDLISGKGDLIDTAQAAKALSEGKLLKNTYILGPKSLSNLYNLEIVESNLQDDKTNFTSFMVVTR